MDSNSYRLLMRQQAGAVTIIAVGDAGNRTGLTATAVCSLTDSPPTLLVCVNRTASAHSPIRETRTFSVRVYTATELLRMLERAGYSDAKAYGSFAADPFTTSTRLVLVAAT